MSSHISYSQHSTYDLCPRFYYYQRVLKLAPNYPETSAMDFGTLVHKALNVLFLEKSLSKAQLVIKDSPQEFTLPKYSLKLASDCLDLYYIENKNFVKEFEVVAAEEERFFYIGKIKIKVVIDLVGHYRDEALVVDFKTFSMARLDMDMENQADYYILASQQLYNLTPDYVLFHCLITTKTPKFQPYRSFRTARNLEDFINDVETFKARLERKEFPRNTTNCYKYWRPCEYKNLCSAFDKNDFNFKKTECYNLKED